MSVKKGTYTINGCQRMILFDTDETLSDVLRRIGFTSVKIGCGKGQCGACTVLLNGEPVRSCVKKMAKVDEYSTIETVEGLGTAEHLSTRALSSADSARRDSSCPQKACSK